MLRSIKIVTPEIMAPNKKTVTEIRKFPKKDKEAKVSDPKQSDPKKSDSPEK